jgi:hypothetical protein
MASEKQIARKLSRSVNLIGRSGRQGEERRGEERRGEERRGEERRGEFTPGSCHLSLYTHAV